MTIIASHSNVKTTSAQITGTSDGLIYNDWQYRISTTSGGGTWVPMLAGIVYTASANISGLSENTTYYYAFRAWTLGGVVEISAQKTFTTPKNTIAPTITASVTSIGTTKFTVKGTSNYTCKTWQYSLNDGSTWASLSASTSATSVSKEITGLTPGTTYQVKVRATRTYNDRQGTSGRVTATTTGVASLNYVNPVNADAATVKLIINWTVFAGFTHTLKIKDGATTVVTLSGLTGDSGANTIDLTGPQKDALLARMPDKKSFEGTFELTTFSGGSQIGTASTKTATVQTNEEYSRPTFPGFTLSEQNAKVTAVNPGGFVQHLSDILAVCGTATAKNGATIVRYGVTIAGKTVYSNNETIDFGAPTGCGEGLTISAWATDSRGYATGTTQVHTVWCYGIPDVLTWEASREDSVGSTTALNVLGSIRTVPNNGLLKAQYRLKQPSGEWDGWEDLVGLTNVGFVTPGRRGFRYDNAAWEVLDTELSYVIQIRFQDLFEEWSDAVSLTVPRGIPLVTFRDNNVGINNVNPQAKLDIVDEDNDGFIVNGNLIKDSIQERVDQLGQIRGYSGTVTANGTADVVVSQAARAYLVAVIPQGSTATANHALSVVMIYNASFGQAYAIKSAANVNITVSGYTIRINPTVASNYRIIEI